MCLSLQHETIPVQLPLTSIITPGMIVNCDMISAHFRMKCLITTYDSRPISRAESVATSRATPGRRIGRLDGHDQPGTGHFAKNTLIFHKMKPQPKDRSQAAEHRQGA